MKKPRNLLDEVYSSTRDALHGAIWPSESKLNITLKETEKLKHEAEAMRRAALKKLGEALRLSESPVAKKEINDAILLLMGQGAAFRILRDEGIV